MSPQVLGLDIGGANLKAAHSNGLVRQIPFELWKHPDRLLEALRQLLQSWLPLDLIAVTMTGELCDCFETRRKGVEAILSAIALAAGLVPAWIWTVDGRSVPIAEAARIPLRVASANWLALAMFAGRLVPTGAALSVDIGSTTTDIVPLSDGKPIPRGHTDAERLRLGELVYTGVRRTPVCALAGADVAAELFATTLDAYLLLGEIEEDASDRFTADGRPALWAAAHARLARMLGADYDTCKREETLALAAKVKVQQIRILQNAVQEVSNRLPAPPRAVILSGSGEFLAKQAIQTLPRLALEQISLTRTLGPAVSQAACAYAVAVLASEQIGNEK
jgi:(4-(4-[2-(gamma-L-glutamylamino)ethyl]phenoxymethyl)furan-2-yl)methanamine synthase